MGRPKKTTKIDEKPKKKNIKQQAKYAKIKQLIPGKQVLTKEEREKIMENLISRSRRRGFITYAEIQYSIPNIEQDVTLLEDLYSRLAEANIQLIESADF